MPLYGENPWLEVHKRQQAENDPWKVQWPTGPRIPTDANAKTAREIVNTHKVAEFVNQNLNDPEVRALLPEGECEFGPVHVDEWEIWGTQSSKGWSCSAVNGSETVNFRLSASLDQQHAITTAARAIREKYGTNVTDDLNDLEEGSLAMIQRLAVSDPSRALFLYMHARLPDNLADELGDAYKKAGNGDDSDLLSVVTDPVISYVNNEGCYQIFLWRTPQLSPEVRPLFDQFVGERIGNQALTIPVLEILFKEWQTGKTIETIAAQQNEAPTEEELRSLPDEALTSLYFQTLGEKHKAARK
jgi:hypothetical protein